MADYPLILLLRHGQTDWNASGRVQGQMESDLTETGRAHAARQGEILAGLGEVLESHALYCSPLRRARQTAEIALGASRARVRFDDRLKEVHAGDWQGWLREDIPARWPEFSRYPNTLERFTSAPGGERFDDLETRARAFLGGLTGPSVIIAHGIINAVMRGLILGLTRAETGQLKAEQGVVLRLESGSETTLR